MLPNNLVSQHISQEVVDELLGAQESFKQAQDTMDTDSSEADRFRRALEQYKEAISSIDWLNALDISPSETRRVLNEEEIPKELDRIAEAEQQLNLNRI